MQGPYEVEECEGLKIEYYQDEDAQSPDDWDSGPETGAFIVTTSNRHFEVIPEGFDVEVIGEHMQTHKFYEHNGRWYRVYPLFAYVHSGVSLSLGRGYPFDCQWDSGQIGWVLVDRRKSVIPEPDKCAESIVEEWNQYLSGNVWAYSIENENGECLDSCSGFYGLEYCKQEANEAAKHILSRIENREEIQQVLM